VAIGMVHHKIKGSLVAGFLYLLTFDKTYRNLFYYRIGTYKYLMYYWVPPHNSFVIASHSEIGEGFLGYHPIGTFVNAQRIGTNFVVRNNVTIGNNRSDDDNPIIGNHVTINAGAVVIGRIKIGNDVVIGAGSVVTKDVLDNCVVIGNPALILEDNGVKVRKPLR
jgi:serine O-acetyltransferase